MTEELEENPMTMQKFAELNPDTDDVKYAIADSREGLEIKINEFREQNFNCAETRLVNKEDDENFFMAAKMVKSYRPVKSSEDKVYIPEESN